MKLHQNFRLWKPYPRCIALGNFQTNCCHEAQKKNIVWTFSWIFCCCYAINMDLIHSLQSLQLCKYSFNIMVGFVVRGESPGCRLISTASMFEWLRNLLPNHSQGSSTERWSRNTPRVVTARVFYVLMGFLTSPFILNNSVETAAPFNVVSHPRCSEPRN